MYEIMYIVMQKNGTCLLYVNICSIVVLGYLGRSLREVS